MTTAYAQELYHKAATEVAERGAISSMTYDALRHMGLSVASIFGLEKDLQSAQSRIHEPAR